MRLKEKWRQWTAALLTVVYSTMAAGCAVVGWAADVVAPPAREVSVKAEYEGLADKEVAVMVAADEYTLYRYTKAPVLVAKAVGGRISAQLPSTTLVDPGQIESFQKQNPYWNTLSYGELLKRLNAGRLLVIDLVDYTTRDPENKHVWRGAISANITVAEADSADPDASAYSSHVTVKYPQRPVALLDSDEQTIQLGMLKQFARRAVGLFHDHKEIRR